MGHGFETIEPAAIAELPAWDETAALAAVGDNAELARELLGTLLKGLPAELAALDAHLQAQDWPSLAQAAHRMRGATCYCGVPALDTALQDLERVAKAGKAQPITDGLRRVEREAERLQAAVAPR